MTLLDISVTLHRDIPIWPNSPGFHWEWVRRIGPGVVSNNGVMRCDMHAGTHIDAPLHFVADGATVDMLDPARLIGPCEVVAIDAQRFITAEHLESLHLPAETRRLLLKTRNSQFWAQHESTFQRDFAALNVEAAQWLVEHDIDLIGVDYHSVQHVGGDVRIHQILLEKGLIIVESLNLSEIEPGSYELICLPLKILGAEAAPARALLRPLIDTT